MYVITHHHSYDEVLLGPVNWNPGYMSAIIQQDLDLDERPTITREDESRVPYDILPNVRVRPVTEVRVEIDPKLQQLDGPYWTYTRDSATATYAAKNKSIEQVQGELKQLVAVERYTRENAGTGITINGTRYTVETARGTRDNYFQKYLLLGEADTINFKFPEGWAALTKEDMGNIVAVSAAHVQSTFDWELAKKNEIEACTELVQLGQVVLTQTPQNSQGA